jgi:hypothetical protein
LSVSSKTPFPSKLSYLEIMGVKTSKKKKNFRVPFWGDIIQLLTLTIQDFNFRNLGFFFFWWDRNLNSGLQAYKAGLQNRHSTA